jgi:hypothetical protein
LNYWRREMTNPDREEKYGIGGVRRMHNPAYLQKVVYQHRWLTEGPGDRPDPKLARRCEEIVAACPEYRDERTRALSDPWTRAIFDSYWIGRWYDPEHLAADVHIRLNPRDPYSPEEIGYRNLVAMLKAGASLTISDIATGEVLADRSGHSTPESAAETN